LSEIEPARLPEPPYYAVIFTSVRTDGDNGYAQRAEEMLRLAAEQPGFLGVDSTRGAEGLGITVSYWRDEESIKPGHAPLAARTGTSPTSCTSPAWKGPTVSHAKPAYVTAGRLPEWM